MKKLFLILLISLSTCDAIEESFDDHIILEKSIESSLKPQTRIATGETAKQTTRYATGVKIRYETRYKSGVTTRHIARYTAGVTSRYSPKVKTPIIPRKTIKNLKYFTLKGINNSFRGNPKPFVKKGAYIIKKNPGQKYSKSWGQFTEKACSKIFDFAVNLILKNE